MGPRREQAAPPSQNYDSGRAISDSYGSGGVSSANRSKRNGRGGLSSPAADPANTSASIPQGETMSTSPLGTERCSPSPPVHVTPEVHVSGRTVVKDLGDVEFFWPKSEGIEDQQDFAIKQLIAKAENLNANGILVFKLSKDSNGGLTVSGRAVLLNPTQ
ncbi:hypothetical protein P7C70_g9184, partial [Phenoliferia sp. Uapishka_3]